MSSSSMLTTQGLIFATAMAVSAGSIVLFDLFHGQYFTPNKTRVLKSCLSSGSKKMERDQSKKKKRVQFANDVKDSKENGDHYRQKQRNSVQKQSTSSCGKENNVCKKMAANRVALYSGVLKDRVHRVEYSY